MTSQVEGKTKKKNRMGWSAASEAALIDLWPSKIDALRGNRKNGHIYAEMSEELRQQGYSCSPRDIQVKLQNFTQRYRKEKVAMGVSGGSPSTWCYYETVHGIIGGFKANVFEELVLESIDDISNSTAVCAPSPNSTMSEPSSPLLLCSPSPKSSTSEPERKRKKFNFKEIIIEKFDSISMEIENHLKKSEENERELIEIERQKVKIMDELAEENKKINMALISFLNKK